MASQRGPVLIDKIICLDEAYKLPSIVSFLLDPLLRFHEGHGSFTHYTLGD